MTFISLLKGKARGFYSYPSLKSEELFELSSFSTLLKHIFTVDGGRIFTWNPSIAPPSRASYIPSKRTPTQAFFHRYAPLKRRFKIFHSNKKKLRRACETIRDVQKKITRSRKLCVSSILCVRKGSILCSLDRLDCFLRYFGSCILNWSRTKCKGDW